MNIRKVTQNPSKGKRPSIYGYDHYVAVDWSLRIMAIARMTRRSNEPTVFERASDIKSLKEYLDALHGRVVVAIEETTTAQWMYLELIDHVDEIIVCDPYHNRLLTDGPKTDKIDACKLCLLLRAGLLKAVFHSAGDLYELRRLVSAYDDLVKAGVRAQNQQTALRHGQGDTGKNAPFILEHLSKSIELYRSSKEEYEVKFLELATRNKLTRILLDITGIGAIGAVKIVAIVVDAHRFPRAGHYLSYCLPGDGFLLGSWYRHYNGWGCIDLATGKTLSRTREMPMGSAVRADGLFYCLAQDGWMALVDAAGGKFRVVSRFRLADARKGDAWAHPVILDGRLYLRYHDRLECRDIRRRGEGPAAAR